MATLESTPNFYILNLISRKNVIEFLKIGHFCKTASVIKFAYGGGSWVKQIIFLFLLAFLAGCGTELEPSKYADEMTAAEDILLEIEDDSLNSEDGFIFRIQNNSDNSIAIGREYLLERYDKKKEEWLQIPLKENIAFQADGLILNSGSENSFSASFDIFNYNFPEGDYRIIKVLSSEGDELLLYDDFKLVK